MLRRSCVIWIALLLAGCNLSVPAPTPTVAPTRTPTVVPQITASPTHVPTPLALLPTATETSTITASPVPPTITPSVTVTASPTLTATATRTARPTRTATVTASRTPTATVTASRTPTATLTSTPSFTPTSTPSRIPTLTATVTPSATPTVTATSTPRPTLTATVTSSRIPTATSTPSATPVPPTATATPLPPTVTPLPIIPTHTPTATITPSVSPTPSATPSNTPRPLPSPTRTLTADELALFNTATPAPMIATQAPSITIIIPTLPPTLDATPTFITAQATVADLGIFTPIPAQTTPVLFPSSTPSPQPTVALRVTLAPIIAAPTLIFQAPPTLYPFVGVPASLSYSLSADGSVTGFTLLPDIATTLFERNPVNPDEYVTTDTSGNLYITGVNGSGASRPDVSPFSQFIALNRDQNDAYVSAARWSPNGQWLAFIVAGGKQPKDGVWVFQPGATAPVQLLVDCPPGCGIVLNPFDPNFWQSVGLEWSPASDALLVRVNLPEEGRAGLIVLPLTGDEHFRDTRPPVHRYEYGAWSLDGGRILVSGRSTDGHVFLGWIGRDGGFQEVVLDARAFGLWMGFGRQAADGAILALGAPGGDGGPAQPLALYDAFGNALTAPIGDSFPERVEWSPAGNAVFVQANGRQFIANRAGNVTEITGQVAPGHPVNWVNGAPPEGQPVAPMAPVGVVETPVPTFALPEGVIAGSSSKCWWCSSTCGPRRGQAPT